MTQPPQPDQEPTAEDLAAGAALATLVAAQGAMRAHYRAQAIAIAAKSAQDFTGWYDTAAITAWASKLAGQIEALQRATAQGTDAYLARALSQLTGGRVRPVGRVDVADLRTGVTHAGAYARAADVYRWQQSQFDNSARSVLTADNPQPFGLVDPVAAAVERVKAVADMDVQLADRAQTAQSLGANEAKLDIRGYRRVVHPELSAGGSCGLCIAASTRFYHVADLRPVHGRCECTSLPIVGQLDPGNGLNSVDIGQLYEDAGTTSGKDLKRTRYQVDENGELGPVLNPHGAKVRTAKTAARDTNDVPRQPKTEAEKLAQVAKIRDSLAASLPKVKELASSDSTAWGNDLARLETRIADLDHQLAA